MCVCVHVRVCVESMWSRQPFHKGAPGGRLRRTAPPHRPRRINWALKEGASSFQLIGQELNQVPEAWQRTLGRGFCASQIGRWGAPLGPGGARPRAQLGRSVCPAPRASRPEPTRALPRALAFSLFPSPLAFLSPFWACLSPPPVLPGFGNFARVSLPSPRCISVSLQVLRRDLALKP